MSGQNKTAEKTLDEIRRAISSLDRGYLDLVYDDPNEEALRRIKKVLEKNKETQKSQEQMLLEKTSKIIGGIELTNTWDASDLHELVEEVQTLLKTNGFIEEKEGIS